jgi:phosphatidylserine decarboxylase
MATVWHGQVNPPRSREVREWTYDDQNIEIKQGEEMGRFLLGSTVVMLFVPGAPTLNREWTPARAIRMGERMSDRASASAGASV